jgi:class 3 adenylate cyclase/YHS domain-containing protein
MTDYLTPEQLSKMTNEPAKRLERWQSLGLIGTEQPDVFLERDIGRCRLIHDLLHYGIDVETIANAARDPESIFCRFLEEMGTERSHALHTLEEASEISGLSMGLVQRLVLATGIGDHGEMVDLEDIRFLQSCKTALDAGYPEEALLQVLRVYADAMYRVAEIGNRSAHFYLHQPLREQGYTPTQVVERLRSASERLEPLVKPAILYFHNKGAQRAEWDDMLMHLEEEAGLAEKPEAPGQIRRAIMFVDLVSFTPLAEAMGDVRAAEILERFGTMVRRAVQRCHGRIVKQIGDAFMIVFSECYSAVSCGLELEEVASKEPQFPPVRVGLHWGPVLYREGDYIGSNVNIASRLTEEAHRHQFLLTDEVRRRAKTYEGVEFIRLGRRRLKGLAAEVEVFEGRAVNPLEFDFVVDPVCGMELGRGEIAARLTLDSREHAFCSDECLRKFIASPELYVGATLEQETG